MRWYRLTVTIGQLHIFNALYLTLLVVVVIITRARMRRIVGALVGTFGAAAAGIAVIAVCEESGRFRGVCLVMRSKQAATSAWDHITTGEIPNILGMKKMGWAAHHF